MRWYRFKLWLYEVSPLIWTRPEHPNPPEPWDYASLESAMWIIDEAKNELRKKASVIPDIGSHPAWRMLCRINERLADQREQAFKRMMREEAGE